MKGQIQNRTKQLALAIIKLSELLPNNSVGWTFKDQIVRSSTSVTANYRAVCRVKSEKEFIAKMGIVIEEADETLFWLKMIEESKVINQTSEIINSQAEIKNLKKEANEFFVASVKTMKNRLNQKSTIPKQNLKR